MDEESRKRKTTLVLVGAVGRFRIAEDGSRLEVPKSNITARV
jgi:hypothetical protein